MHQLFAQAANLMCVMQICVTSAVNQAVTLQWDLKLFACLIPFYITTVMTMSEGWVLPPGYAQKWVWTTEQQINRSIRTFTQLHTLQAWTCQLLQYTIKNIMTGSLSNSKSLIGCLLLWV